LFIQFTAAAQYKYVYYLDKDFGSVSKDKAFMIGRGFYESSGSFRLECFSINDNFLFITAHFTDSTLSTLNGSFQSFARGGHKENVGTYVNNIEEGAWTKWNEKDQLTDSSWYVNGKPKYWKQFEYYDGGLFNLKLTDYSSNEYWSISYNDKANITSEAYFMGDKGIVKNYSEGKIVIDTVYSRVEREATFEGGDKGWIDWLGAKLVIMDMSKFKAPEGKYTVIVKFIVGKKGEIRDVRVETDPGYGMGDEAVRIISSSPKWIPALQYGKPVNAYRRQPLTFSIESE
jgi:hypothetical protein